jgi:hypothetical protein
MAKAYVGAIIAALLSGIAIAADLYETATISRQLQLRLSTSVGHVIDPPRLRSPIFEHDSQEGFDQAKVSRDKVLVGWLALFPNSCTSYPIPLSLVLFRDGHIIATLRGNEAPIWQWAFEDDDTQVAFVQRPTHGGGPDHYELYSITPLAKLAEYDQDEDSNVQMPHWVKAVRWR